MSVSNQWAAWLFASFFFAGTLAHAEPGARPDSGPHVAVAVGGFLSLAGVTDAIGPALQAELYPGGWFGRFGGRVGYHGFNYDREGALLSTGITYTAAATRPKAHIALHGDLAVTADDPAGRRTGVGAGMQSQLWVLGPVALGLDTAAYVLFGGGDPVVQLLGTGTLRLSF
jgi:hypothetical protein